MNLDTRDLELNTNLFDIITGSFTDDGKRVLKELMTDGHKFAGVFNLLLDRSDNLEASRIINLRVDGYSCYQSRTKFTALTCLENIDDIDDIKDPDQDTYDALTATFAKYGKDALANLLAHSHKIVGSECIFLDNDELKKKGKILCLFWHGSVTECNRDDYSKFHLDISLKQMRGGFRSDVYDLLTESFTDKAKTVLDNYINDDMKFAGVYSFFLDSEKSIANKNIQVLVCGGELHVFKRQNFIEADCIRRNTLTKTLVNNDLYETILSYCKHGAAKEGIKDKLKNDFFIVGAKCIFLDNDELQKDGKIRILYSEGTTSLQERKHYLEYFVT